MPADSTMDPTAPDDDTELTALRTLVLNMGTLTRDQQRRIVTAILEREAGAAFQTLDRASQLECLARDAEEAVPRLMHRGAHDRQTLLALSRIARDIEHVGREPVRLARQFLQSPAFDPASLPLAAAAVDALRQLDAAADALFARGLGAVAALDTDLALAVLEDEPRFRNLIAAARAPLNALDPALAWHWMIQVLHLAQTLDSIGLHGPRIAEHLLQARSANGVRYRSRSWLIRTLRGRDDAPAGS